VGIAPEEMAQLGQAFAQAQAGRSAHEGTGLGLAISRGFVELMGGQLTLHSRPGQGTTARFSIALQPAGARGVQDHAAQRRRRPVALAAGTPAQRILVVDDWPEGRLLLTRLLAPLGFEVREAADGEQAIAAWQAWAPQLILMDMRMPVLDGLEATRRIKASEAGRATIVVALTASSFEEQRAEILDAGCDDFVRKPFDEDVLLELIARHLGVRYVFDDEPAPSPGGEPDAARLAALAPGLRQKLHHAVQHLDVAAIDQALAELREADAVLAEQLAPLAARFQYREMQLLLDDLASGAADARGAAQGPGS
jgi:CheY-like chemotaxis protein